MECVQNEHTSTTATPVRINESPKTSDEKLQYIVDHFDELVPFEDRSLPGIPIYLKKAVLLYVLSKKEPGDTSVYLHEIITALTDVQRKGTAVIKELVGRYLEEDVASQIWETLESYRERIDPSIQLRIMSREAQSEFVQFVMSKKTPDDRSMTQHDIITACQTLRRNPPSTLSDELHTVVNTFSWQDLVQLVAPEVERCNLTRKRPILLNTKVFVFDGCPDIHHLVIALLPLKDGLNWARTNKACWDITEFFYYQMLKTGELESTLGQQGLRSMTYARIFHKHPELILDNHVPEERLRKEYKFNSKTIVAIHEKRLSIEQAQQLTKFIDEFKKQSFPQDKKWDTSEMEPCRKWVEEKLNNECLKTWCSSTVQFWPELSPVLCLDVLLCLSTQKIQEYCKDPSLFKEIIALVQRDPNTATLIYFLDKLNGSLIQHYIDAKKYSFGELFNLEIRYGCSFDVTKSEYDEHAVPYCEFMPHLTCPAFEVYVDAGHLAIEKFPTITRQQRLLLSAPEVLDALEKSKFSMDWFYSLEKEIIAVCEAQQPPAKSEDMIALLSAGKFTSQHMKVLHKNGTLAHFTPWNTKLLIDNVLSLDDVVNQTEICQRFNQEWVTNYLKYYRNYLSIDDVLNETATYQRFGQQWVQDLNLEPNDVKDEAIFERFNQPWVCEFYHTNWLSRDDIRAKTFAFKNLTQAWVRELIQERQITPKSPLGQLLRYNVDRAMIQTQYEAQRFFANAGAKIQSFFEHGQ